MENNHPQKLCEVELKPLSGSRVLPSAEGLRFPRSNVEFVVVVVVGRVLGCRN